VIHFRKGATTAIKKLFRTCGLEVSRVNSFREALQGINFRDYVTTVSAGDPIIRRFMELAIDRIEETKSQNLQDLLVDFILDMKAGFFVEFGATDGVDRSNSHFLQYQCGWRGILAEPARHWHEQLSTNRPGAVIDKRCVWRTSGERLLFLEAETAGLSTIDEFTNSDGHAKQRARAHAYEVDSISLNDLLSEHNAPAPIDYLSVDTEGSEFEILCALDFDRHRPAVITVEHNFTSLRERLHGLIVPHGYVRVFTSLSLFDDWYVTREAWNRVIKRT
jgi:FkbM family methyltransferase